MLPPTSAATGGPSLSRSSPGNSPTALYANTGSQPPSRRRRQRRDDHDLSRRRRAPARRVDAPRRDVRRQRRCGCTSTAPRSRSSPSPARSRPRPAAADRRQQHLGRVFQGLIDEVRVYNRALTAGRDPERHGRSVTPGHHALRRHGADAGDRRRRAQRRHVGRRRRSARRWTRRRSRRRRSSSATRADAAVPATVTLRPRRRTRRR